MSLFYGIQLYLPDFYVHLMGNDPEFRAAFLAYLHDLTKDSNFRKDFGRYEVKDVIGDITEEYTGRAESQCYDDLLDAKIDRVRYLLTEAQQKREAEYQPTETPLSLPLSLFEDFEVEIDYRHSDSDEEQVYIGQRIEVYRDRQRQEIPADLTLLHKRLEQEFPQRKVGFIQGY